MNEQQKYDWKVFAICMTYNQAPYIEDALIGFVMQKTDFPYVCAIVDDASTDGEQEVIKQYLNDHFDMEDKKVTRHEETADYVLTFARHKTNLNCYFAVFYLKYNHYSIRKSKYTYITQWRDNAKFTAICEGDDYWTDPLKLQKQVKEMDENPDASMAHTRFNYLYVKDGLFNDDALDDERNKRIISEHGNDLAFEILEDNHYRIQPMTVLYRNSFFKEICNYLDEEKGLFMMGDTQMWINLLSTGRIIYLPDITSVYRVNINSASKSEDKVHHYRFELSCEEMRFYYAKKLKTKPYHFYWRYLKILIKYKWYHPEYETNIRVLKSHKYIILPTLITAFFNLINIIKK